MTTASRARWLRTKPTAYGVCGRGGPRQLARCLLGPTVRGLGFSELLGPRAGALTLLARLDGSVAPPSKSLMLLVRNRHRLSEHGCERVHLSVFDVGTEEPPDAFVARDEVDRRALTLVLCRCSDVSHSVDRDFLTDFALLEEGVRLGDDDPAVRDGDQCLRRGLVPRCRQLLLRPADDRGDRAEGVELVGETKNTQGLTVLDVPPQDAEVRLEFQRFGAQTTSGASSGGAGGRRASARGSIASRRRAEVWRAAFESLRFPGSDGDSVSRPGSSAMMRSSRVSASTRPVVSGREESSSVRVSRAMTSTSRASSASSRPAVLAFPARSAW